MGTKNKLTKLTIKQTRKGLKASDVDVMSERLQAWAERLYALISVVEHDLTAISYITLVQQPPKSGEYGEEVSYQIGEDGTITPDGPAHRYLLNHLRLAAPEQLAAYQTADKSVLLSFLHGLYLAPTVGVEMSVVYRRPAQDTASEART